MSKAFTRESDAPEEEGIPSDRRPPGLGARNYMTQQGVERLRKHLDELIEAKRTAPELERRKLETDIRAVQRRLSSAVVPAPPAERDKIAFGASVTVRHADGEQASYRIVGVEEAEPEQGAISWMSPLARVLLSRRAGDKLRFQSPAGMEDLTILAVDFSGR